MILKIVENVVGLLEIEQPVTVLQVQDFDSGFGKVPLNVIEAKGDLIVGTGAGTIDNLPAGNSGHLLSVSPASPTGLAWVPPAGGIADHTICNGRLTLASGTPIPTSDQTDKKVVYFTPFRGNLIGLYYQGAWSRYSFSELSIKLEDTQTGTLTSGNAVVTGLSDTSQLVTGMAVSGTGIPGETTISSIDSSTQITLSQNATASGNQSLTFQIPASEVVDVFAFYTGAAVKLEFGALWTNATTRAVALTTQDGILVKSGDATRRYLGTVSITATAGQTEDSHSRRLLWNYYNRAPLPMCAVDTTDNWEYASSAWRYANGNSANKIELVIGVAEVLVAAEISTYAYADAGRVGAVGVGVDTTSTGSATVYGAGIINTSYTYTYAKYYSRLSAGYHYLAWLEKGGGAGKITWTGDDGGRAQTGMTGLIEG